MNLRLIPPTSNIVERFFSIMKLVLNPRRLRLYPYHLECLMFARYNADYWNVDSVLEAIINSRARMNHDNQNNNQIIGELIENDLNDASTEENEAEFEIGIDFEGYDPLHDQAFNELNDQS